MVHPAGFVPPTLAFDGDMLVLPLLIFLIFYFIVIRPGARERKSREAKIAALKKHDKVITNAGIHGTVVSLEDDAVILRVDDNVRIKFSRAAIWQVLSPAGEKAGDKSAEKAAEKERKQGKPSPESST